MKKNPTLQRINIAVWIKSKFILEVMLIRYSNVFLLAIYAGTHGFLIRISSGLVVPYSFPVFVILVYTSVEHVKLIFCNYEFTLVVLWRVPEIGWKISLY